MTNGRMNIAHGTHLTGQIRGGRHVEIDGSADGSIATKHLVIGPGGSFQGSVRVESADIHGKLRGDVTVRNLLNISETGDVEGEIRYGQLALAAGSNLVADLRNVPPELAGDFELEVLRGGSVKITPEDLNATDADDGPDALKFTATNLLNGHLAHSDAQSEPLAQFTQADINAGNIVFVHGGGETSNAGFDVVVVDDEGASAGPARPVLVRVHAEPTQTVG
jgi:cytoskeletal protein CcmA (bactofilin family)